MSGHSPKNSGGDASGVKIDFGDGLHTPDSATKLLDILEAGRIGIPAVVPWSEVSNWVRQRFDQETLDLFSHITGAPLERIHYRPAQWAFLLYLYAIEKRGTPHRVYERLYAVENSPNGIEGLLSLIALDAEQNVDDAHDLDAVVKTGIMFLLRATSIEQIKPIYNRKGIEVEPKKDRISARVRDATLNFPFLSKVFSGWGAKFDHHYVEEQVHHLHTETLFTFLLFMRNLHTECSNKKQLHTCEEICIMIEKEIVQRVAKKIQHDMEHNEDADITQLVSDNLFKPWAAVRKAGLKHAEEVLQGIEAYGPEGILASVQRKLFKWFRGSDATHTAAPKHAPAHAPTDEHGHGKPKHGPDDHDHNAGDETEGGDHDEANDGHDHTQKGNEAPRKPGGHKITAHDVAAAVDLATTVAHLIATVRGTTGAKADAVEEAAEAGAKRGAKGRVVKKVVKGSGH